MPWKCNCPLCRLLVHPVLRLVSGKGKSSVEHVSEVKGGGEVGEEVPLTEVPTPTTPAAKREEARQGEELELSVEEVAPPLPTLPQGKEGGEQPQLPPEVPVPLPQQPQAQQEQQARTEVKPQTIEVEVPKELVERIDQLEEEIGKLRKELSSINESLKNIVLEVKEALAEASSPFNVLSIPEKPPKEQGFNGGDGKESKKTSSDISKLSISSGMSPSKFVELLMLVQNLLRKMSKDKAILILKGYIDAGVIDKNIGESLTKIVDFVDQLRKNGISIEEQIPYLYMLTKTLGINDPKFEEMVLKEFLRRGKLDFS